VLIVLAAAAVVGVTAAGAGAPLRAPINLFFVLLCPGLSIVRLARLRGFVSQLVLSLALSIALAGTLATAQVFAGAWSPPATLAILVGLATAGVLFDPWLVVPRWESRARRSIEGRVVPVLLLFAAAVAASRLLGEGVVAGAVPADRIASAAAAVAGGAAMAAFVGTRSDTALYASAILLAAGLPGVGAEGSQSAVSTALIAGGHAVAWIYVAWLRVARGGGVGWQATVFGAFLVLSTAGATIPSLPAAVLPAGLVVMAAGLALSRRRAAPSAPIAESARTAVPSPPAAPSGRRSQPLAPALGMPADSATAPPVRKRRLSRPKRVQLDLDVVADDGSIRPSEHGPEQSEVARDAAPQRRRSRSGRRTARSRGTAEGPEPPA